MPDPTRLTYWFPKLEEASLPVPKTRWFRMPKLAQEAIWSAFDNKDPSQEQQESLDQFTEQVAAAGDELGWPCFLRTDLTSGKHEWDGTCDARSRKNLHHRFINLAMYSEMAGFLGLPWETMVIREFLPTKPYGVCRAYGHMPICKEFRFFVQGGEVLGYQPYWPEEALEQGRAEYYNDFDYDEFSSTEDLDELITLARDASIAVPGYWSVDILDTERGWFITDMAEGEHSYKDEDGYRELRG